MKDPHVIPETSAEADEDYREYLERAAALDKDLDAGRIHAADHERRKAEAWEVYRSRSGRLRPREDDSRGRGNDPQA